MDLDNGIIIETLQTELILPTANVTRIVGDLLSEINSLTEMLETGKEVTTPTHEMGTDKVIEASFALRKAREETLLNATHVSGHDPSKPITLVFRTSITNKAQASLHMNRSSHNTKIRRQLIKFVSPGQMMASMG